MALHDPLPARRRVVAGLGLALLAGPFARAARAAPAAPVGPSPADATSALAWRERAEAALAAGRPLQAVDLFERAARLDEADATAELGQVRAWLQAGDGAQARAWSRLVAGEHADDPRAEAWAGAVERLARGATLAAAPRDTARPQDARPGDGTARDDDGARDTHLALPPPPPRRPVATPADARFEPLAAGLIDGPTRRLLLPPALRQAIARHAGASFWVTDGTGTPLRLADDLATLSMDDPAAEPSPAWRRGATSPAPSRAVAGRPVAVLHAPHPDAPALACATAWPRLAPGLLTWPAPGDDRLRVDLPGPRPADGSPVFDACGGWLGWFVSGALVPAPGAAGAPACASRAGGDALALHDRWYAAVGTVWRRA